MRVALILVLLSTPTVAAGTFSGERQNVNFRVREYIDGVVTSVDKDASVSFSLKTDYSQIEWTMSFDVDLLMAGGPGQPFETRLRAKGALTTDAPSPLSFPNVQGTASAGEFSLAGPVEWEVSQRIVNATNTRQFSSESITLATGLPHHFNVANYPASVQLTANFGSGVARSIGLIGSTQNGLAVHMTMPYTGSIGGVQGTQVAMSEILPGDFNDTGVVDAADYTVWRDSPGIVAPLLTSYSGWKANYGRSVGSASLAVSVPEPMAAMTITFAALLQSMRRRRR